MKPTDALVGLAILSCLTLQGCGGSPTGERLELTVPYGATFRNMTDTLHARGIVDHPTLFRGYARLKGVDASIKAGRYRFRRGEAWSDILRDVSEGRVVTERMTVPEGFTTRQMIPGIAAMAGVGEDSVASYLSTEGLAGRLGLPGPGLEGYLFPDTYLFAPGTSVPPIVRAMADRYRAYWTPERSRRADSLGMSRNQVTTLASIIQAEARVSSEMPLISGVYWNRLEQGHPLQADPTVLYALGGPRQRLLYAAIDSVADSPYNTYERVGLPPGPIGAPGEEALDAALHPADTDFFYFVARPGGDHVFSRTLAEHNRAKAAARRAWDSISAGGMEPQ